MRRMKDSGIAWIGEIPEVWETIPLARVIKNRVSGNWGVEPTHTTHNIICIRVADFDFFKFSILERTEYTQRGYKENEQISMVNYGDILFEKSGGGQTTPVGRSIFFDKKMQVTYSNFIDKLTIYGNYLDRYVFFFFLICYLTTYSTIYIKQTTGIQNFDLTNFLSKERICLPPLPEQHRIAAYLDAKCAEIDRSMELARQSMDTLKAYRMSIITEAVTKGLDPDVPMKDSGVPWIGEIPEHWKCCPVKYFGDIVGGTGFPLEYQGNTEEIYPFYKVSDLELSSDGKFLTTHNNSISEEIAELIHAKIIRKQSIVYAKIGAALLLNRRRITITDSIIDNNMSAFTPISGINLNWCFYLFTVIDFSIFIYPGTVPSFSEGSQSRIKVPVPPKDTQDKISAYLDAKCAEIDAIIARKQELLDKLAAYKKSLIYECVTGKREVAA